MSDDTADKLLTRQALEAVARSAPGKVTGRLLTAVTEMVWKGARRAEAAKAAGMTDHSLRAALRKPHVKAFYLAELGTIRESERAKTFHRLTELRDQDENKAAAVSAAKALEQINDEQAARPSAASSAGVIIRILQISTPPATQAPTTDVVTSSPEPEPVLPASPDPIFRIS